MFKRPIAIAGFLLLSLALGLTHGNAALTQEFSSNANHKSNSNCKVSCSGDLYTQNRKISHIKKDKRDPFPHPNQLEDVASSYLTSNLLAEKEMWRSSSWVPPDHILLAYAYSTTL